ncbi:MAG: SpoIIE family protein phosphatase [bacterium]|nr:SpoIIE family protein phosphatase [bacterium]
MSHEITGKVTFGLRLKFVLLVSLLIVVIMVIMALVSDYRERKLIRKKMEKSGKLLSEHLAERCMEPIVEMRYPAVNEFVFDVVKDRREEIAYIYVVDDQGMCIVAAPNDDLVSEKFSDPLTNKALKFGSKDGVISDIKEGIEIGRPMVGGTEVHGAVRIGFSLAPMKRELFRMRMTVTFVTVGAMILGFLVSILLAGFILRPVGHLVGGAQAVADGNFDHRIPVESRDELGILAGAFNQMTEKLYQNMSELQKKVHQLSNLNRLGREISRIFDLGELLQTIVVSASRLMNCERCSIMLLDKESGELRIRTAKGLGGEGDVLENVVPMEGGSIAEWVIRTGEPLIVTDAAVDSRIRDMIGDGYKTPSFISVPLLRKEEVIGVFSITDKRTGESFNSDDLNLLTILASQVVMAIENADLYRSELDRERMEKELNIAHDIQMNMLPEKAPEVEGLTISARSIPAKEVGGDYFDFVRLDDRRLAMSIGDVAGKGVPAALLMALMRAVIRTEAGRVSSPREVIERVNALVLRDAPPGMYATLFYGVYDLEKKVLTYTNAGHNYPMLLRRKTGKYEALETTGLFVGMFESPDFEEESVELKDGDILVFYTDGVTEAQTEGDRGEMFGLKRLLDVVKDNGQLEPEALRDRIYQEVFDHMGGNTELFDDITLIIARCG